ncbi:ATP-dependent RNA helicase dbp10 [Vanrija albida]|uniref:RNA helicase n=1 Tax=Vanrija albida TaxID=181172 RepID=A0ABR3Q116_9TREE
MATQSSFKADWIPSQNDGSQTQTSSKRKSAASWQQLGLSPQMTRALGLRGFKQPTPIQRLAIPSALENPPRDILGMARTGSGKTLAYLIPMLQRLGSRREPHGIRCLILCPSRELAVQILKAGKDLSRSLAGTDKSSALRWSVIMGGESLDQQFEKISEKPDIVIATPGRFLHIVVEMNLDLRGLDMVIYDEADRLFEMGFEVQLREILHRLPASRHSLLFSATLPSSLAEFAKAGLNNPNFIRLDTEHRISPSLKTAFVWTKPDEKDAALLILLRDAIGVSMSTAVEGSAWTIVTKDDLPFLLDLEVFLDRPITGNKDVFGAAPRESLETAMEYIQNGLEEAEPQLPSLREVMKRGQSMFERSRSKASREAYQKAKTLMSELSQGSSVVLPVLQSGTSSEPTESSDLRERLLGSVQDYRPPETIFEIGSRAETEDRPPIIKKSYRDPNFFLPHENVETAKNKGYSLNDDSFAAQARSAILDLQGDEGAAQRAQKASQMKWDKKSKRFVKGDGKEKLKARNGRPRRK